MFWLECPDQLNQWHESLNRRIANGRSAWETCFWFRFGGISFLLYTGPYAWRVEPVYHLHKQTQIFSVSF